jgi:hypothetical protein
MAAELALGYLRPADWAARRLSARSEGSSMPPFQCTILDAVSRSVTQAAGACARGGGPVHAAARLRCASLGDVEAEPERALLLTVRRCNTVQDDAAHRYSAPSPRPAEPREKMSDNAATRLAKQVALDARLDPER